MTKEQYNRASELKADIIAMELKIKEANRLFNLCEIDGGYIQYWCNVIELLWNDEKTKNAVSNSLFSSLVKYKVKMEKEKEKLEKQFEEL